MSENYDELIEYQSVHQHTSLGLIHNSQTGTPLVGHLPPVCHGRDESQMVFLLPNTPITSAAFANWPYLLRCTVEGIRGMPIIISTTVIWTLSRQAETDMTALLYQQLTSSMSPPTSTTVKETESDYAPLGRVV